jgi:rRNA maturation protein Nop10
MPLTDREKQVLCTIGSELYEIAKPTRFDMDSVFVKVRRSALEAFADKLKAIRQGDYER